MLWIGLMVTCLSIAPTLMAYARRISLKRKLKVQDGGPIGIEREAAGGSR